MEILGKMKAFCSPSLVSPHPQLLQILSHCLVPYSSTRKKSSLSSANFHCSVLLHLSVLNLHPKTSLRIQIDHRNGQKLLRSFQLGATSYRLRRELFRQTKTDFSVVMTFLLSVNSHLKPRLRDSENVFL